VTSLQPVHGIRDVHLSLPEIFLKGTVARDFLVSVFLMDVLYMGLRLRS
jgi:hypothetical protein